MYALKFLIYYFLIFFFLGFILTIIATIYTFKNNKLGYTILDKIYLLGIPAVFIALFIPIELMASFLKINNTLALLVIFGIILTVYLFLRLGINIINKKKIEKVKFDSIYIRDIDVNYSPAVLSYLKNQKLEPKKDIVASILNLCSKNLLYIKKINNNQFKLVCKDNNLNQKLNLDEQYLYKKIVNKEKINVNKWRNLVKKEYKKHKFSKHEYISIYLLLFSLCTTLVIGGGVYNSISPSGINEDIFINIIIVVFFSTAEMGIVEGLIQLIQEKVLKTQVYNTNIYSTKGIIEIKYWEKYKKFLQDFTLIKDKSLDSVILLEKHLAYAMVLNENKSYEDSIIENLKLNYSLNIQEVATTILDSLEDN